MKNDLAVDGLVIHTRDVGDHDRYLTVLTAKEGRITLLAKGAHSMRNQQGAVSQLYTYANFEFVRRGTLGVLRSGSPIESFYGISRDMDRLNLAAYFCEVAEEVTDEGVEAGDFLRLMLNSLFALSRSGYPIGVIKSAFEFRVACDSGYSPDLSGCAVCGKTERELFYLDVMNGVILCPECLKKRAQDRGNDRPTEEDELREAEVLRPLPLPALAAMRYIRSAPIERIFSFSLSDSEDLRLCSGATETYLLSHLGRGFDSLQFYHTMLPDEFSGDKGKQE